MQRWAVRLSSLGGVHLFDYPYMLAGRHLPDRLPQLIAAHQKVLEQVSAQHPGKLVLVGKSMGSRVSCHVANDPRVSAVVCFGYPLLAGGKVGKSRDAVLKELQRPALFLQGTRDPLCPLDLLEAVRAEIRAPTGLHVVESGDHSLQASKAWLKQNGSSQEAVETRILGAVEQFLAGYV